MASVLGAARPGAYRRNPLQAGLAAIVLAVFALSAVVSLWSTAAGLRPKAGLASAVADAFPLAAVDSAASLVRADVARRVRPRSWPPALEGRR